MKKINKKAGIVISSVALALGILAVPVLAGTDLKTETQANATPVEASSQTIKTTSNESFSYNSMSTGVMQNMHNSTVMQDAMNSGDINNMNDAMNSPEIKAQLGEDVVNSMNQMMSNGNMNAMHSSQGSNMMGSGTNNMMNWQ